MKKNNIIYIILLNILFTGLFGSCSPMDEYLDKYTNGKEIQYTGIVYPAIMYSGKNRVVFYGLLMSDPKVSKIKIYWNSRRDSVEQDIVRTSGVDQIMIPISLTEGGYNFEIFTYDKNGNSSIPINLSATSYGDSYQESLHNRLIKNITKSGSTVVIDWYSADPTSPFVEINYPLENGEQKTVKVPQDSVKTTLVNFMKKSVFSMNSFYLPDEQSIDTFKMDSSWISVKENVTNDHILNTGLPFLRGDGGTTKWGTPLDWLYTSNVLNQDNNTKGGWSTIGSPSGVINFESRNYSGDGITNGKIYQTVELPAGKYIFESYSSLGSTTKTSFLDVALVAAKGTELPNIENITTESIGYYKRQAASGSSETYTFEFNLTEQTQVTLGWVASFGKSSSIQFTYVKLYYIPQK